MNLVLSDRVVEALNDASPAVCRAFEKQLWFLAGNLNHPSLRAAQEEKRPKQVWPQMNTDKRRWKTTGLSVFICVYLWLKLVFPDFFSILLG